MMTTAIITENYFMRKKCRQELGTHLGGHRSLVEGIDLLSSMPHQIPSRFPGILLFPIAHPSHLVLLHPAPLTGIKDFIYLQQIKPY